MALHLVGDLLDKTRSHYLAQTGSSCLYQPPCRATMPYVMQAGRRREKERRVSGPLPLLDQTNCLPLGPKRGRSLSLRRVDKSRVVDRRREGRKAQGGSHPGTNA